jgi:hypothetical protein
VGAIIKNSKKMPKKHLWSRRCLGRFQQAYTALRIADGLYSRRVQRMKTTRALFSAHLVLTLCCASAWCSGICYYVAPAAFNAPVVPTSYNSTCYYLPDDAYVPEANTTAPNGNVLRCQSEAMFDVQWESRLQVTTSERRILCMAAKQGPNVLFCMPNRTWWGTTSAARDALCS